MLKAGDILLRPLLDDDQISLATLANNKKIWDNVRDFLPNPYTNKDAEAFIKKINDGLESNEGITWGIELDEAPGILIGTIGYWRIMKEHSSDFNQPLLF